MMATPLEQFQPLFRPKSIAVVGASSTSVSGGNRFIRNLKAFGYEGRIIPIHPSAETVEDLPATKSLADLKGEVDYAYVAIAAPMVPKVLRSARGKVKIVQVMSSGFGEVEDGRALEKELAAAANESGIRVIGPNCLGTYSPGARLTFTAGTSPDAGAVGIVCQSGGLGVDILRRGRNRGLLFSGLVTAGNCADVSPAELLEYFLASDDTKVVGLYLESIRDGRRLFEVLRESKSRKPVVILKGGRTEQGARAALSHTGALVGNDRAWSALSAQTGAVLVDTLDEFLDALTCLQCLPPSSRPTKQVVLFGNGGGTSVLGTDAFSRSGFELPQLLGSTVAGLEALELPAGSSIRNPIDTPAGALQQDEGRLAGRILDLICTDRHVDAIVIHINMTVVLSFKHVDMLGNLVDAALRLRTTAAALPHLALVLRSDGDPDVEERKRHYRLQTTAAGIPVFDEMPQAARALRCLRDIETFRADLAVG
jgi:acetate---CoA ligase (ADP-forming)